MNQMRVVERLEVFRLKTFQGVSPSAMTLLAALCFEKSGILDDLVRVVDPESGLGLSADEGIMDLAELVSVLRVITPDYEVIPQKRQGPFLGIGKRSLSGKIVFDRDLSGGKGNFRRTIRFHGVEAGIAKLVCDSVISRRVSEKKPISAPPVVTEDLEEIDDEVVEGVV